MLRARVMGIAAAAALAAGAAAPSAALAKATLKLQASGETLATGAPLVATSANFHVSAGVGGVVCQDTTLAGEVETNSASLKATALFTEATLGGEAEGGECTSTYAPPLRHAHVELTFLSPLRLTLTPKLEATIRPIETTKPGLKIGVRPLEEHPKGEAASCIYTRASLTSGTYHADGSQLTVAFPPQRFGIYANSGLNCRRQNATVSATFTFSSGGIPVDALIG